MPPRKTSESAINPEGKKERKNKNKLLIGIAVLVVVAAVYYFKDLFLVAIVNNQPILRLSLVRELEKQAGKQVLNSMIAKILIDQEAKKQNIIVSEKEIQDEVKKIEKNLESSGQNLDQVLQSQGMTRQDLEEQMRLKIVIDKILGKDVSVTDEDVNNYIQENKISLVDDEKAEESKKSLKEQIRQTKINEKSQLWIEDLQAKAKINYLIKF